MFTWYWSVVTQITIFKTLGMLYGEFYSSQTQGISPKMSLICCCRTGKGDVWPHILYLFNIVPFYSVF